MQRLLPGGKISKKRKTVEASGSCPICSRRFPERFLLAHASECVGESEVKDEVPPGLLVVPDFLTETEENDLLLEIECDERVPWVDIKSRRTKNYGPKYNISKRVFEIGQESTGKRSPPVPESVQPFLERARKADPRLRTFNPNQLGVTLYNPNEKHQILPHSDAELMNSAEVRLSPVVVGISLCSQVVMTFVKGTHKLDVPLPRRSMYVMAGESFTSWNHAIFAPKIKKTRISLTFRQVVVLRDSHRVFASAEQSLK